MWWGRWFFMCMRWYIWEQIYSLIIRKEEVEGMGCGFGFELCLGLEYV